MIAVDTSALMAIALGEKEADACIKILETETEVMISAGTVAEALSGLVSKHPELRRHLYTDDGKLRSFVNVYLNDEDVRYLQKEATAIKDSDTISIVPSIAGGW